MRRGNDEVSVLQLRGDRPPLHIRAPNVHGFGLVGDQVWVVAGSPAVLSAFDARGTLIGSVPVPEPGPSPRLLRAPSAPLASWIGTHAAMVAFDKALATTILADDIDFALPLSSTRTITASRSRLALREQEATRWSVTLPQSPITDGALVLDGKAVAITATTGSGATIFVVGLRDGAILHRITAGNAQSIRFAADRGVALIQTRDSHLVLVDLRFGRVIVEHASDRAIADAAVDGGGRQIALCFSDDPDEIVHVTVADLVRSASTVAPAREPLAPAQVEPAIEPSDEASITNGHSPSTPNADPDVDPFATDGLTVACKALPPRTLLERTTFEQTAALNARHRDVAFAMVSLAIARAWDEGRLAYPQTAGLPFHSEVQGLASGQRGLAIDEVMSAQRRLEDAAAAAVDARKTVAPALTPLDALGTELELDMMARDLLLLAAAPSLWGEIARLYGILSNDDGRPLVDEQLLHDLMKDQTDRAAIARELDIDAPLMRFGLIRPRVGKMRPFLPLTIDPVALRLLRGGDVESELEPLVMTLEADRTFEELRIPTKIKAKVAADLAHTTGPLRVVIRGRIGSGRHTLVAAIAAASGRKLGVIDVGAIVRDPRVRLGELGIALERAQIAGMLPCVDGLELIASDDVATRDSVRELLRRHPGPLAVRLSWEAQPPIDPGYVAIDLPTLNLTDRLISWQRTLGHHHLEVRELAELGDRYAVGPGVMERVAAEVARTSDETDDANGALPDAGPRLEQGIRQHLESRLGTTANRVARLATWAQVILPTDIQDSLTELIARIKHRRIVFDKWGFDHVMSTSRGVTALFQGGPGTGKTLVASAIANELGMDLYRVDLSRVMSKWIGETEQNLAKLFDAAEDGNAIILFDEADSLFAKRTEVKSSVDRYANLEVNYLLQRIDTFEGIAILTTNFGTSIDNAFKRRLSLRFTFPFPDEDMRERLWRTHLPAEVPTAGVFDLAEIARKYRLSGGYIRNAALRAAFLAAEEHSPLTQDHLERAIKAEFREIGKIAESGILE